MPPTCRLLLFLPSRIWALIAYAGTNHRAPTTATDSGKRRIGIVEVMRYSLRPHSWRGWGGLPGLDPFLGLFLGSSGSHYRFLHFLLRFCLRFLSRSNSSFVCMAPVSRFLVSMTSLPRNASLTFLPPLVVTR